MKVLLLAGTLLFPLHAAPAPPEPPTGREVLSTWDAERSAAWATGDVRRLRDLYTSDSVAGARDVAMLRRWLDRGLVVTGLRMQVLSLEETARSPDRLVLDVVDRVVGATAGGTALPQDRPTEHTLVLRLVDGEWRVSAVR